MVKVSYLLQGLNYPKATNASLPLEKSQYLALDILVPFLDLPFYAVLKECALKSGLALKIIKFKACS